MLDILRTALHDAFCDWVPTRRNTKGKLEEVARNLQTATALTAASAFMVGLVAHVTFRPSASLMAAAAGAGIGVAIGAGASYCSAEVQEKLKLAVVAIDTDRKACEDILRTALHVAFRRWLPTRRNTKGKLEEVVRNLQIATALTAASALTVGLVAHVTFGPSAGLMAAAAGAGIGVAIGAGASYRSAMVQEKLKLAMVAIDTDRRACEDLQLRLVSLMRTFTFSTKISNSDEVTTVGTMVGAAVSDVLTRASRFVDSSVLPRNITQLVESSLDRNGGSTSSIVQEIMGILNNLNCPDESEMPLLVESFIAEAKYAEIMLLTST